MHACQQQVPTALNLRGWTLELSRLEYYEQQGVKDVKKAIYGAWLSVMRRHVRGGLWRRVSHSPVFDGMSVRILSVLVSD